MAKILIAVASRHGGTLGLADALAGTFQELGHDVTLVAASDVSELEQFDAIVLGSAVYMGNWLGDARALVEKHGDQLRSMPVWLFSSGPLGAEELKPEGDPAIVPEMMEQTAARGHRVFAGKLEQAALGIGERIIARVVGAPEGDFRDWDDIRAWAVEIARELAIDSATGAPDIR